MNAEEKALYEQKFAAYQASKDVNTARTKAIADVETCTAEKNKALQEAYDKQAQYEEWIAWQEAEKNKRKDDSSVSGSNSKKDENMLDTLVSGVKSYVKERFIDDAVHIAYKKDNQGNVLSVYYVPSSKKKEEHGIIFKDPGYRVDVVYKKNNKIIYGETYSFYKPGKGWLGKVSSQWLVDSEGEKVKNSITPVDGKYYEIDDS